MEKYEVVYNEIIKFFDEHREEVLEQIREKLKEIFKGYPKYDGKDEDESYTMTYWYEIVEAGWDPKVLEDYDWINKISKLTIDINNDITIKLNNKVIEYVDNLFFTIFDEMEIGHEVMP